MVRRGPPIRGERRRGFDDLISAAVEQVLTGVFGETGAAFIFNGLRRRGLEKRRIPEEIGRFSGELVEMLGSGGLMLLNRILDELAADLDVETPGDPRLGFEERLGILIEGRP